MKTYLIAVALLIAPLSSFGSSIWNSTSIPALADSGGAVNLELGVKFRSDVAGTINGIRFYKSAANTGTHIGHLWSKTGVLLGSVTFTAETASGWQQANFAAPIQILAGVTYIASYFDPNGHFSLDRPYFTKAIDNPPLHALADGVDGPNGVYLYPAGFPTANYQQSNYWVDVDFSAAVTAVVNQNLSVTGVAPTSGAPTGGTQTTVTGTGFQPGAKAVFGTEPGTANAVQSSTQMQSTTPPGSGQVIVTVKNVDAAASTQTFTFAAVSPPLITSVLPPTGPLAGGTIVVIGGVNFVPGAKVSFGTVPAQTVTFVNSTQITCLSPAGVAGSVPITVSNPDGQAVTMVAAFVYADPIVVVPPTSGGAGLLSGMTPTRFTVPAGWSLAASQDFETGSVGANQYVVGSITASFGHGGTHSLFGQYAGDAQGYAWFLRPGVVARRETYVSWYEYNESQMRFNDEMFLGRFFTSDPVTGGMTQELVLDWYGQTGHTGAACDATGFNALSAEIVFIGQAPTDKDSRIFGPCNQVTRGGWDQWEVHFKANDPNVSNGVLEVFKNGTAVIRSSNQNFNYGVDMTNQSIEVGGVYTKLVWGKSRPDFSCTGVASDWIGDGLDSCFRGRERDFTLACWFPSECPTNGFVPKFKRYWDDIIVLRR